MALKIKDGQGIGIKRDYRDVTTKCYMATCDPGPDSTCRIKGLQRTLSRQWIHWNMDRLDQSFRSM